MSELKKYLCETIGQDFVNEGFSMNKTEISFRKKIGRNGVHSIFLFNDFPSHKEFYFVFRYTISEIEDARKNMYASESKSYASICTVQTVEGDFHPATKNKLSKYRLAYVDKIYGIKESHSTLEDCRILIKEEFFKRIPIFTGLEEFQRYVANNYEEVIRLHFVKQALIALSLLDREEFYRFVHYLLEETNSPHLPSRKELEVTIQTVRKSLQKI